MKDTEIRLNDDGTLDEVVGWGFFHLEQMSDAEWILLLDTVDGKLIRIPLYYAKGKKVAAFAEIDGPSTLATPLASAVDEAIRLNIACINENRKRGGWPLLNIEGKEE